MLKFLLKCIAGVLAVLALIFCVSFISITSEKKVKQSDRSSVTVSPKYTLSEYKGKVALYKSGYAMPVEIYDIYVDSLPDEEKTKVEEGIDAQTDEEIIKIIEAYTS